MRALFPLYLVIFFGSIGYSLIITLFTPMVLSPSVGLLPAETPENIRVIVLGAVIFLYPFGQFVSSPILGAFSDRFGRKRLLLISLTVALTMYFLVGVGVLFKNLWLIAAALFAAGLSEGNTTIAQSAIADNTAVEERTRLFGYVTLSASFSYIVGPFLGGKLISLAGHRDFSFALPFFVVSLLLVSTLVWLFFSFKESLSLKKRSQIPYFEAFTNLKNLFLMRHVRFLFGVNFFIYFAITGYFQSFPIYIVQLFKLNVEQLSLFIAWSSFPFIIVNIWLTKRFAKKFSNLQITLFSSIWIAVAVETLLIPNQIEALWFTLFFVGMGISLCLPASAALLSASASEYEQGRVMGINQSLQFFAEAFSGLLAGLLASVFIKLSLIIFGFLSLVGALLLLSKRARIKDFSLR